jgi:hypothetical protein
MLARFFSSKANSTIVAVGVVFHLVYLVSIVDIYFRTPLVHGVEPIQFPGAPPAKRLVLFVGKYFFVILQKNSLTNTNNYRIIG